MLDSVLEKLLNNTPLALVVIGVILFVTGAAGGLSPFSIQVAESGWRIALAILGLVLIGVGFGTIYRSRKLRNTGVHIETAEKEEGKQEKQAKETFTDIPLDPSTIIDKENITMTLDEFLEKNSPEDLKIKITVPQGFNILGSNKFLTFPDWLSNPIGKGDGPGVNEYPIKGEVIPHVLGLVVEIKIQTNQWWPQSKCFVQSDGTFSGSVWLHRALGSATFRFDILNTADGRRLNRFDVYVA